MKRILALALLVAAPAFAQTPDDLLDLGIKQAALRQAQADYDVVRKRVIDANAEAFNNIVIASDAAGLAALKSDLSKVIEQRNACRDVAGTASEKMSKATTILGVRAAAAPLFACLAQ